MKPGDIKIIDRVSAVEAIKHLNEDDLRFLNRMIVERLKLISQARATTLMVSYNKGDRVGFQASDGRKIEGTVLSLNKKTINRYRRRPPMERLSRLATFDSRNKKRFMAVIRHE